MKRILAVLLVLVLAPVWAGAELSAWFLDVGQGDCTVIVCDGAAMVIDGVPWEPPGGCIPLSGMPLKADVLRVAHHGSTYSTTDEFLSAVSPRYAVISCGKGNGYGHPHGRALNLLERKNVWVFRTDLQGTARMASDGKQIKFSVDRWADKEALYKAPTETRDGTEPDG